MVNIGLLGTGIFAKISHHPAIEAIDGLQLVAVSNRTKEKAEAFAKELNIPKVHDNVEDLIADNDVDVIDALLPVQFNLATVQRAVAAGKPIAFEKPIAANLEDARKIVELAESTDVPVMVLENYVYVNPVAQLKKLLPEIGKVATFEFKCAAPYAPSPYHETKWRQKPEHIGGYISDGGVHQIALLTEVLGEVESVSARAVQLQEISGDIDTFNSLFNLKSGAFGTFLYGTYFAALAPKIEFTIFGSKGNLVYEAGLVDGKAKQTITHFHGDVSSMKVDKIDVAESPIDGVLYEFENFKQAVDAKDKNLIKATPRKAFHHFAVIVAGVKSAGNSAEKVNVETL